MVLYFNSDIDDLDDNFTKNIIDASNIAFQTIGKILIFVIIKKNH